MSVTVTTTVIAATLAIARALQTAGKWPATHSTPCSSTHFQKIDTDDLDIVTGMTGTGTTAMTGNAVTPSLTATNASVCYQETCPDIHHPHLLTALAATLDSPPAHDDLDTAE